MAALSEDAIFDVARQINSQEARNAYLDQACDGNQELRARLEELLAAHEAADSRLDRPLMHPTAAHAMQFARHAMQFARQVFDKRCTEKTWGRQDWGMETPAPALLATRYSRCLGIRAPGSRCW